VPLRRRLLNIGKDDVILTISSAGCNVLDYLCEAPKAIVACDLNAAQLAVLELKLACIRTLEHGDFFRLWAESDVCTFERHYRPTLRAELSEESRAFWDASGEALFRDNFMFAGTSGLAAKLLQPATRFLGLREYMARRLAYPPASVLLAVVRQLLAAHWLWAWFAPLGGVPRAQAITSLPAATLASPPLVTSHTPHLASHSPVCTSHTLPGAHSWRWWRASRTCGPTGSRRWLAGACGSGTTTSTTRT
jgi:hypothetical protein